jgi:hypothetical protein
LNGSQISASRDCDGSLSAGCRDSPGMVSTSGSGCGVRPDRTMPSCDDHTAAGGSCSEIACACVGNVAITQIDDSVIDVRLGLIMAFTLQQTPARDIAAGSP